ncbi:threonylcarbamoyladenosine tRNA methylthiotransferase MtaB [Breznakia blatticola]|uniref:Threonylcarbamoyladenosine tRNA methylthiotransferase MtaB n=1 Tax=Breznakia blatticola TaxID=1754012 RepID=A0A4R7ZAS5_9FIRM|nr:tRNA (N(6)-L-threonylcarbamoyladenosine(37)-C(2))-methylthiotransferase MtaB [Breznakia blatticola]TDW14577.1 threonylcarbamoyladenosine tRNA methylthiotransferase MtaB [Breznakia blatticola]
MKRFAIATLGCKVNLYESESYVEQLQQLGYQEVDFKEVADIYIINTCAVTNTASQKSRQKINQAKTRNANAFICVVGCYVQSDAQAQQLDVDLLVGSNNKDQLATVIDQTFTKQEKANIVETYDDLQTFETLHVQQFHEKTRAFLKIQDGCNQFCSYCIIPYARGKERSIELPQAIKQAKQLVASGHKEIVLTGIHTGRYGDGNTQNLVSLLKEMVKIDGLLRIRISSIEMNEITDEMLQLMASEDKIAKHLHIPIQSGSDTILQAMNRPYRIDAFKEKVKQIRKIMPTISISSDMIMGFPGESEKDVATTVETVRDVNFSFLHVFPFSKRDGTKAETLKNHLPKTIKKERCALLSKQSKQQYATYLDSFINQELAVLFEYEKDGYAYGHSSEYIQVKVKADKQLVNQMVVVKATGRDGDILVAK